MKLDLRLEILPNVARSLGMKKTSRTTTLQNHVGFLHMNCVRFIYSVSLTNTTDLKKNCMGKEEWKFEIFCFVQSCKFGRELPGGQKQIERHWWSAVKFTEPGLEK